MLFSFQEGSNPLLRFGRLYETQPILARHMRLGGHHLNGVPVRERMIEWNHLTVHASANRSMPDIGVNRVGEINTRGAIRQSDQVSLWSKDEHLFWIELSLYRLNELVRILEILLSFNELFDPLEIKCWSPLALLVSPMSRDTLFGDAVHLWGSNLNLDALTLRPNDRRMQRLIHIWLRHRDEIFEPSRHRLPR